MQATTVRKVETIDIRTGQGCVHYEYLTDDGVLVTATNRVPLSHSADTVQLWARNAGMWEEDGTDVTGDDE